LNELSKLSTNSESGVKQEKTEMENQEPKLTVLTMHFDKLASSNVNKI
jgi:hypothetical protein